MKSSENNNIGLALEIISIYLSILCENHKTQKIYELKKVRKKIYECDEACLKRVLYDYSKIVLKQVKNNNNNKFFYKMSKYNYLKMLCSAKKYLFYKNVKNNFPTAIIIGGQQGSGKTGIVLKSINDFQKNNQDAIVLDLDSYRGFYKRGFTLMINNPHSYAEIINRYAGKIMENITNKIIKRKYNFIFEGTLGKSAYTLELLLNSKTKYNIIVRVLAVCKEESIVSNFERYIEIYKRIGMGRLTTIEKHNETFDAFTNRLKELEKCEINVEVYSRGYKLNNPILIYSSAQKNNAFKNAYSALIEERKKSYNILLKSLNERLKKINENQGIFMNDEKMFEQLLKLNKMFNFNIEK